MSEKKDNINSSKIKQIMNQEFDLEILLKNKDLKLVEQEIGKAEAQLTALRAHLEKTGKNSDHLDSPIEPNEFSKKYVKLLSVYRKDNELMDYADEQKSGILKNGGVSNRDGTRGDSLQLDSLSINKQQVNGEENGVIKRNMSNTKKSNGGDVSIRDTFDTKSLRNTFTPSTGNVYRSVANGYMTTRSQSAALRPVVARMRPSTKSVQYRYQEKSMCICRRSDKVLVSLKCHKCGKVDFLSPQGFINHYRIAHEIEVKDVDEAAMKYGTLLPKEEQDDEGLKALEDLEKQGLDPALNLNKATIFSDEKRTNSASDISSLSNFESLDYLSLKKKRKAINNSPDDSAKKIMRYNHLKAMIGDKVEGFDELAGKTTELVTDVSELDEE